MNATDNNKICSFCSKEFKSTSQLYSHITHVHTKEKPYQCRFCEKSFTTKYFKVVHEATHTGDKLFKCRYCQETFQQFISAKRLSHENLLHPIEQILPNMCQIHNKLLPTKSRLRRNEVTHPIVSSYKCEFCQNSFSRLDSKIRHVNTMHLTGRSDYQQNNKVLKTKKELSRTKTVENLQVIQCQYCNKQFTRNDSKGRHERIHTGGNSQAILCRFCSKLFTRNDSRIRHERIHISKYTSGCIICNKLRNDIKDKDKHDKTHTQIINPEIPVLKLKFLYIKMRRCDEIVS